GFLFFEQGSAVFEAALASVIYGETEVVAPQAYAGVFAVVSQGIENHLDRGKPLLVVLEITGDAFQSIETGFLRRHSVTHVVDDCVRPGNPDILFAAACCSRSADVLVDVESRADDRRIADAAGDFPGESTGGRGAGHFALRVQGEAIDGAG